MVKYKPSKRTAGQGSARVQRKFQILSVLYSAQRDVGNPLGADVWLTTGQIAREINLTTSPHFRGMLDELLGGGFIRVSVGSWRANMPVYQWSINPTTRYSAEWKEAFEAWLDPEGVLA